MGVNYIKIIIIHDILILILNFLDSFSTFVPHFEQNLLPGLSGVLQFGHFVSC